MFGVGMIGRALRDGLFSCVAATLHPSHAAADDEGWRSISELSVALGGPGSMWRELLDPPLLAVFSFALFVLGVARWRWSHRHGRFFTVVDGQLFRSGAIPPDELQRKVRRHGIRAVIDLRSARPEVEREREALSEVGCKHFHLPSKQIPRAETVDAVLALLDDPHNRPALVHCNHGVRRAAQFEAICRMEYQRWSNDRALSVLRRRSAYLGFGRGSRSRRFIQSYVPRRERLAAAEPSLGAS
jgi:protein tyrosine phosphatase (PTP) superfamily phosphohydrolase (DUF442 family)